MKYIYFLMILLCVGLFSISCSTYNHTSTSQEKVNESKILFEPEQQPHYIRGGSQGLLQDLYTTMQETIPIAQDSISRRAVVRFTITEYGLIDHNSIKVILNKSVPDDYMNAAIEAIKHFGKFEPGKMNGTPVSVTWNLPIIYPIPTKFIKKN